MFKYNTRSMEFNKYFSIAKREVSEAIVDNKRLILLMASVYLISIIVSGFFSSQVWDTFSYQANAPGTPAPQHSTTDSPVDLFINNETAGIVTYLLSIFFGINAFVSLILNGTILGVLSGNVIAENPIYGISTFLAYTLPHGIFEIPACIFESVAGMLLFLFVFRFFKTIHSIDASSFKLKAKKSWEVNKVYLKQSIVLMIFCCFLLIIAAFVEAYITDFVGNWVDSFFK